MIHLATAVTHRNGNWPACNVGTRSLQYYIHTFLPHGHAMSTVLKGVTVLQLGSPALGERSGTPARVHCRAESGLASVGPADSVLANEFWRAGGQSASAHRAPPRKVQRQLVWNWTRRAHGFGTKSGGICLGFNPTRFRRPCVKRLLFFSFLSRLSFFFGPWYFHSLCPFLGLEDLGSLGEKFRFRVSAHRYNLVLVCRSSSDTPRCRLGPGALAAMENAFAKPIEEVLGALGVDPAKGLSDEQVSRQQAKYGKNGMRALPRGFVYACALSSG